MHYKWIDIGTPNVSFMVALDAGSDLLSSVFFFFFFFLLSSLFGS